MTTDQRPYAVYVRVSSVKAGDLAETLDRQEELCTLYLKAHELTVGPTFVDRGVTASKAHIERPQFDAMMSRAESGEFGGIICWKMDRLTRQMRQLPPIIDKLALTGAQLISLTENLDTSTFIGQAIVTFIVAMAAQESESNSMRVSVAEDDHAVKGLPPTGGKRCYGFVGAGPDRGHVIDSEADAIRAARDDMVTGLPIREVTRRMNDRGSLTTTEGEWTPRSLTRLLKNPRLRGKRTHHKVLSDGHYEDGTPWEVIFTEAEHLDLIHRIDSAGETYSGTRSTHLLSGLATCSTCGHKLGLGYLKGKSGQKYVRYACKSSPGTTACGRCAVSETALDAYVIAAVRMHGQEYVEQAEAKRQTLEEEIAADERDLATNEKTLADLTLARYAVDTPLTDTVYAKAYDPLTARIAELTEKLSRPRAELEKLPGASFLRGAFWKRLPEDVDGRAYLRTFLSSVEVMPASTKGGRFDGSRVKLHWLSGEVTSDSDLRTE
jgi:site-specific DNA recombinase